MLQVQSSSQHQLPHLISSTCGSPERQLLEMNLRTVIGSAPGINTCGSSARTKDDVGQRETRRCGVDALGIATGSLDAGMGHSDLG